MLRSHCHTVSYLCPVSSCILLYSLTLFSHSLFILTLSPHLLSILSTLSLPSLLSICHFPKFHRFYAHLDLFPFYSFRISV